MLKISKVINAICIFPLSLVLLLNYNNSSFLLFCMSRPPPIVSSAVFALSSVKNFLPSNIKLTIYNSLFRSFIEYAISAWGCNKCSEMKQIHILQKRAIRLIDNSKATSHSDPLFLKYKILKINDLVDFNQAIFMYKYTHKLLPASFENILKSLETLKDLYTINLTFSKCAHYSIYHQALFLRCGITCLLT